MKETNQQHAERHGYQVHHDLHGFYVVSPREVGSSLDGFDKDGKSFGFDGRPHYLEEEKAWEVASIRAARAYRREKKR